jgi:hypothetical protein
VPMISPLGTHIVITRNATSSASSCPGFAPHFGVAFSRSPRYSLESRAAPWLNSPIVREVTHCRMVSTVRASTASAERSGMVSRSPSNILQPASISTTTVLML